MRRLSGFSLMEMMIVLLIVAIVAAASAPMVSRKMLDSSVENTSPWQWVGLGGKNATFNPGGLDATASIGAANPAGTEKPKLFINIAADEKNPHITFGEGGSSKLFFRNRNNSIIISNVDEEVPENAVAIGLGAQTSEKNGVVAIGQKTQTWEENAIAIGNSVIAKGKDSVRIGAGTDSSHVGAVANNSIAIGALATSTEDAKNGIAIGPKSAAQKSGAIAIGSGVSLTNLPLELEIFTSARGTSSIAIGTMCTAKGDGSIAMGSGANTNDQYAIAIGAGSAKATAKNTTSIGYSSSATAENATAIGYNTKAQHEKSTAIGQGATTTAKNQIVIGTSADTVYIPGKVVIGKRCYLNITGDRSDEFGNGQGADGVWMWMKYAHGKGPGWIYPFDGNQLSVAKRSHDLSSAYSDRRLKNVGETFTDGIDKIRKIKVFNYTFKNDTEKTPRVGVMAQDLQKIFPNAVTKGDDGYLRIRMEDMFYAAINAIQQNDKRISELEKQNKELLKRIEKLEKSR